MKGSEFCQRKTKKLNVKQLRIEKRIVMKNLHLHKMLNLTKNVNCSTGATWASVHIRCGDSNHAERSDHYMEQVCQNYWFKCLFLCIKMSNLFLRNELNLDTNLLILLKNDIENFYIVCFRSLKFYLFSKKFCEWKNGQKH